MFKFKLVLIFICSCAAGAAARHVEQQAREIERRASATQLVTVPPLTPFHQVG
jgi:hypothetical protein